jgi:hypothetical protein
MTATHFVHSESGYFTLVHNRRNTLGCRNRGYYIAMFFVTKGAYPRSAGTIRKAAGTLISKAAMIGTAH